MSLPRAPFLKTRNPIRSNAKKLFVHEGQRRVLNDKRRFRVVVAGRRWGKTRMAITAMILAARHPKRVIWYVAPTYRMARDIMWRELKDAIPRELIFKVNETLMTVQLVNGTLIACKGADKPDCYDEQTEVLTDDGWKRFSDLSKKERVLTLNPETKKAEWHKPTRYIEQNYDGPMYRVASKRLDLLVTPNHKFFVENRKGTRKFREIENISTHQDRIPARCGWDGIDIPDLTEDMCAIIGLYLAEGCAYGVNGGNRKDRGWPVFFSQTKGIKGGLKGNVRDQFKQILDRAGFNYRETPIGLNVQNKALYELLFPLGTKYTKRIPRAWLDLPSHKLKVILHWMLMGDGNIREKGLQYYTVSRGLADDVQELAIKAGYSASIVQKPQAENYPEIRGRQIKSNAPLWEVRICRNEFNYFRDSKENYVSQEWYTGKVRCVEVQNHVIMVRRNDKICWSGNSLRGVALDLVVIDEAQDCHPDVWYLALRPTLSSTGGDAIIIGTPRQYNWFYDVYMLGQRGDVYQEKGSTLFRVNPWKSWQFPTISSPFIPPEEVEAAKHDMDEKSFRQEYQASFESMSGRVYHAFERSIHIGGQYVFNPNLPIWVGQDFNIDPMTSVIMQPQANGEIWIVDEIVLFGSNTQETADKLGEKYFRYINRVTVYPDPAGQQRSHSRGESDLDILRDAGFRRLKYRRRAPFVADRINAVNRMFRSADGTIRMRINASCKNAITAFEQTIYKPGTRDVDKTLGIEHAADATGYCVDIEFPVRKYEPIGFSR